MVFVFFTLVYPSLNKFIYLSFYHLLTYLSMYLLLSVSQIYHSSNFAYTSYNFKSKQKSSRLNYVIKILYRLIKICSSYMYLQHNNTLPKFIEVYYNYKAMSYLIILYRVCCIQDAEDQLLVSLGMMISCRWVLICKYHIKIDVAEFPN